MRPVVVVGIAFIVACTARNVTLDAARQVAHNEQVIAMVNDVVSDARARKEIIAALRASNDQIMRSEQQREASDRRANWACYIVTVAALITAIITTTALLRRQG